MRRRIALGLVLAALWPAAGKAHRLDEYLQATRVALTATGIRLELDLTPGANIAGSVVSRIDVDQDRRFSGGEVEHYARVVLRDLDVRLDGTALDLRLQHVEVATPDELLDGVGAIRIVAAAAHASALARHQLKLRNDHETARSVYLMNVLVPESDEVVITGQSRDGRQQEFSVEYATHLPVSPLWWVLVACVSLGTLGARRLTFGTFIQRMTHT